MSSIPAWAASKGVSAILLAALCATHFPLLAQERATLDLTKISTRHRLREPATAEVGGSFGPISDNPVAVGRQPQNLHLVLPGGATLQTGDEFFYEIRLQNVSDNAITLPWDPNSADIEPQDPTKTYEYSVASIAFSLQLPTKSDVVLNASILLYSSTDRKDTSIALEPREWVRILAKGLLSPANVNETWQPQLWGQSQIQAKLRANLTFSSSRFTVTATGSHEETRIGTHAPVRSEPIPVTLVSR